MLRVRKDPEKTKGMGGWVFFETLTRDRSVLERGEELLPWLELRVLPLVVGWVEWRAGRSL